MLPDASFDKLKVGDIISFDRPDGVSDEIQHRIVFIKTDENGHRIVMTKGDANQGPIPGVDFPITEDKYTGKLVYVIYDPLGLYRLEDIPIYLLVTPVVASTLYYYYYHQYLSPSSQSKKKKE
jgi:hypothetical protein